MKAIARATASFALILCACYGLTDDEWARVQVWLHCEHCDSTMLAYVDSLGAAKERETIAVLGRALKEGPSQKQRENMMHGLATNWSRIESSAPAGLTLDLYIRHYVDNYVAGYQMHAATALSEIGTERAVDRLREAEMESGERGYREDVVRQVARSYAAAAYGSYEGAVTSPIGFLESTRLHADPGLAWTGTEIVLVPGAPFLDVAVGERWGTDSLEFVVGAWPGEYEVLIPGTGAAEDTLHAPLTITSRRYAPHPRSNPLNLGSLSVPRRVYAALTGSLAVPGGEPVSGNPMDHFEVRVASDTAVLAILDWAGGGTVLPTWHPCGLLPPPSGISGTVFDARGDPGAFVAIAANDPRSSPSISDSLGHFRLSVGDSATYDLTVRLSTTTQRQLPNIPNPTSNLLVYAPQQAGAGFRFSRPDTSVVHLSAGGCAVLRMAKLDQEEEPSIVKLEFYPAARTYSAELLPPGPINLRRFVRPVARLSLRLLDSGGRPLQRPVVWRSMDPTVALVDHAGWVVAQDTGSTSIYAFTSGVPPQVVEVRVGP